MWAIHAVVHTYEMQGRVDDGIRFLAPIATRLGDRQSVHRAQLVAPRALLPRGRRPRRALDIYDAEIHNDGSAGVPIEMLDASALLWRLMLDGVDTGDRFATLADAWAPKVAGAPWYAFNDLHAVMALAGAGPTRRRSCRASTDRRRWLDGATGTNVG